MAYDRNLCACARIWDRAHSFLCLYLIPCYCIFLLNTSNYSCFLAVCHPLFFPVGIACLIFTFLFLYYIASLLYLWICRRNGTNCGQTVPKKWVIHCIHSFVPFFSFFFPSLAFVPCPSKPQATWWHDMLCGKGSQFGDWFFLFFNAIHLPISQKPGIRYIWNTSLCIFSYVVSYRKRFEAEALFKI